MYLSKLELQGFKSFADRTVLHFDPGITAIVGPNGCGKSNIVDAVRWCIGEQRARVLRSERMENVIFNGTSKRRPLGMSEVLLTIENNRGVLPTEYSEVELGRRLYRSGDSEYVMNGVHCRLKDITDLFMDTGMGAGAYSVIELKMVDEILSDNADDRRRLFEEAAGITKYKLRRRQTLSKLDGTQTDLTRIRDLTDEIGKQVRSLQRQARKAERYKEASQKLHRLELALAHVEYSRLVERKARLDEEIARLQQQAEASGMSESREESSLQELRTVLERHEAALKARRDELHQHLEKVRGLETERRLAEERLETSRKEMNRMRGEQEDATRRRGDLEREISDLDAAIEEAVPTLQQALSRLEEARDHRDAFRDAADRKQQALQELRQNERAFESKRADLQRQLDRLLNRRDLIEEEMERTVARVRGFEKTVDELQAELTEAVEQRDLAEKAVADAHAALERSAHERVFKQERVDEALEKVRALQRRQDALAAEVQLLEGMLTSYEDFSTAVQFLAESEWKAKKLNTVSDILACNDEYRIALDAALGSYAGCIVVRNEKEAAEAVEILRRHEQGRATFIVLDRLRPVDFPAGRSVGATPLREVVRTPDSLYRNLAGLLLRDAFVVDTLDRAQALAHAASGDARFFARTGEWVDARGIVHGGSRQDAPSPAASRLGRREQLEETQRQLAGVEGDLAVALQAADELKLELDAIPFERRREELAEAERHLSETEKAAARVSFELKSSESRHAELNEKLTRSRETRRSTHSEAEALERAVEEASAALTSFQTRIRQAEVDAESAEAESRTAANAFSEANIFAIEARNRHDNFQRDLDRARRQLDELGERVEECRLRIGELENLMGQTHDYLGEVTAAWSRIEGKQSDLEDAVREAESSVQGTREAIGSAEGVLRTLRRERDHLLREENQRNVRLAEVQTRAQDLVEHIREEFSISLPDAVANRTIEVPDGFDETSARTEVGELRRDIRALGGVNELALEAYEEEKERLEFLLKQQEDLERAEEKLLETIDEINTTASQRFLETYEQIRAHFAEIFKDLFGADAAADLELVDPSDPLETAIEIKARPRGKKPSTISQLSGGEKTLTAIALLFGIYLVKPSPFCILDEVDAPLDDANIERYMRLIRQFSKDTQFILVTHNKLTMEAADRLYGITMQEQGVSRLVGVKFDDAVEIIDRAAPREAA